MDFLWEKIKGWSNQVLPKGYLLNPNIIHDECGYLPIEKIKKKFPNHLPWFPAQLSDLIPDGMTDGYTAMNQSLTGSLSRFF